MAKRVVLSVGTKRGLFLLESGALRPHVLCILNGESLQRDEVARTRLTEGDEIWIHQAISGG